MGWREESKLSLDTIIMRCISINLKLNRLLHETRNCRPTHCSILKDFTI